MFLSKIKMKEQLTNLSRRQKQALMIMSDVIILLLAIWLSFALRLGVLWPDKILSNLWIFLIIPLVSIPLFIRFGLYKSVLKFMGTKGYCYSISVNYYNKSFCRFCHDDFQRSRYAKNGYTYFLVCL
jgi:FlaA1/EpsC-like NDP-sugar epimerase